MDWTWLQYVPVAMLLVSRLSGLIVTAPFFNSEAIPVRIKVALVVALTVVFWPLANAGDRLGDMSGLSWLGSGISEFVIGMLMGLCVQIVLEVAQFAGAVASFQMGLSMETAFDPTTDADSNLLATMNQLMVTFLLLQLGIHRRMLLTLAVSLRTLPLGSPLPGLHAEQWLVLFGEIFVWGVQLAAPILVVTILLDLALAFFARLAPQLPVMLMGIPVKLLAGYAVLIAAITLWPSFLTHRFDETLQFVANHLHA